MQALLSTESYQEVGQIMTPTFERGKLAGQVELALLQLEAKFGPLSVEVKQRIEALSPEEFRRTMIAFATAGSLKDLGLQIEDMGLGK